MKDAALAVREEIATLAVASMAAMSTMVIKLDTPIDSLGILDSFDSLGQCSLACCTWV